MKRLNAKGMEKLNEISEKYRFKSTFEIEQEEVYDFCNDILKAAYLGLDLDPEDLDWIAEVRDVMCEWRGRLWEH